MSLHFFFFLITDMARDKLYLTRYMDNFNSCHNSIQILSINFKTTLCFEKFINNNCAFLKKKKIYVSSNNIDYKYIERFLLY